MRAGEEGGVEFEAGVFCRGTYQKNGAIFHIGQEAVLLGFVEAVDFVDEQEGALAILAADFGGFEDFAQVGDAGENS